MGTEPEVNLARNSRSGIVAFSRRRTCDAAAFSPHEATKHVKVSQEFLYLLFLLRRQFANKSFVLINRPPVSTRHADVDATVTLRRTDPFCIQVLREQEHAE